MVDSTDGTSKSPVERGMQMQAVNASLQARKTEYLQRIREWQASLKFYDEAVKLDVLRLSLLKDAGVQCASEVTYPCT